MYTKTGISPYDFRRWYYDNIFLYCLHDINKVIKFLNPNPKEVFPLHMEKMLLKSYIYILLYVPKVINYFYKPLNKLLPIEVNFTHKRFCNYPKRFLFGYNIYLTHYSYFYTFILSYYHLNYAIMNYEGDYIYHNKRKIKKI
jgi:hypothetical protein